MPLRKEQLEKKKKKVSGGNTDEEEMQRRGQKVKKKIAKEKGKGRTPSPLSTCPDIPRCCYSDLHGKENTKMVKKKEKKGGIDNSVSSSSSFLPSLWAPHVRTASNGQKERNLLPILRLFFFGAILMMWECWWLGGFPIPDLRIPVWVPHRPALQERIAKISVSAFFDAATRENTSMISTSSGSLYERNSRENKQEHELYYPSLLLSSNQRKITSIVDCFSSSSASSFSFLFSSFSSPSFVFFLRVFFSLSPILVFLYVFFSYLRGSDLVYIFPPGRFRSYSFLSTLFEGRKGTGEAVLKKSRRNEFRNQRCTKPTKRLKRKRLESVKQEEAIKDFIEEAFAKNHQHTGIILIAEDPRTQEGEHCTSEIQDSSSKKRILKKRALPKEDVGQVVHQKRKKREERSLQHQKKDNKKGKQSLHHIGIIHHRSGKNRKEYDSNHCEEQGDFEPFNNRSDYPTGAERVAQQENSFPFCCAAGLTWYQEIFDTVYTPSYLGQGSNCVVSSFFQRQESGQRKNAEKGTSSFVLSDLVDDEWLQLDAFLHHSLPSYQYIQGSGTRSFRDISSRSPPITSQEENSFSDPKKSPSVSERCDSRTLSPLSFSALSSSIFPSDTVLENWVSSSPLPPSPHDPNSGCSSPPPLSCSLPDKEREASIFEEQEEEKYFKKKAKHWKEHHQRCYSPLFYLNCFFEQVDAAYYRGTEGSQGCSAFPIPQTRGESCGQRRGSDDSHAAGDLDWVELAPRSSSRGNEAKGDKVNGSYSLRSVASNSCLLITSPLESVEALSLLSITDEPSFMSSITSLSLPIRKEPSEADVSTEPGESKEVSEVSSSHASQSTTCSSSARKKQTKSKAIPMEDDMTSGGPSLVKPIVSKKKKGKEGKESVSANVSLTIEDSSTMGAKKKGKTSLTGKRKKAEVSLASPVMESSQSMMEKGPVAPVSSRPKKTVKKKTTVMDQGTPSTDSPSTSTTVPRPQEGDTGGRVEIPTSARLRVFPKETAIPSSGRGFSGSGIAERRTTYVDNTSLSSTVSSPVLEAKQVIPVLSSAAASPSQSPRKKLERLVSIEEQPSSSRRAAIISSRSVRSSASMDNKPMEGGSVMASGRRPILSLQRNQGLAGSKSEREAGTSIPLTSISPRVPYPPAQGLPSVTSTMGGGYASNSTSMRSGNALPRSGSQQLSSARMAMPVTSSKVFAPQPLDDTPRFISQGVPRPSSTTPVSQSSMQGQEIVGGGTVESAVLSARGPRRSSFSKPPFSSTIGPSSTGIHITAASRRTVHQVEANPHAPTSTSAQFFPPQSFKEGRANSLKSSAGSSSSVLNLDPRNLKLEIIDDFRDEAYKIAREEEDECASAASSMNSSYCGSPRSKEGTPKISPSNTTHFSKMASVGFAMDDDDEEPFVYDRMQEEAAVSRFFSVGSLNFEGIKKERREGEDHLRTPLGPRPSFSAGESHLAHSSLGEGGSSKPSFVPKHPRSVTPSREGGLGDSMAASVSFLAVQKTISQKTMTLTPLPDLNEDRQARNELVQQVISRASFLGGELPKDVDEQHPLNQGMDWDPPLGEEVRNMENTLLSSHIAPTDSSHPYPHKSVKFALPEERAGEAEEWEKTSAPSSPLSGVYPASRREGRPPLGHRIDGKPSLKMTESSAAESHHLKELRWIHGTNDVLLRAAKSKQSSMQCRLLSLYEAFFLDRAKKKWLVDDAVLAKCLEYIGLMGYEHPQLKRDRAKCQPSMWSSSASIPSPLVEVASSIPGADSVRVTDRASLCLDGVLRRYRLSHKPSCQSDRTGVETVFLSCEEAMRWINSKEYVIGAILMVCAGAVLPSSSNSNRNNTGDEGDGRLKGSNAVSARTPPIRGYSERSASSASARAAPSRSSESSPQVIPCIPPNIHPIFWVALHVSTFYPQWGDFSYFTNIWETQVRLVLTPASTSRQKSIRIIEDGLVFSSDREGGNLANVERVIPQEVVMAGEDLSESRTASPFNPLSGISRSPTTPHTGEPVYQIWLEPDLNSDKRIWFRFSISGAVENHLLRLKLMNAAPHLKLYKTNGMRPVWRDGLTQVSWAPVEEADFELVDDDLNGELSFSIIPRNSTETIQVAFCAPYTYADLLCHLVHWHALVKQLNAQSPASIPPIRFEERLLGYSPEGRKQHVLVITSPFNASYNRDSNKAGFQPLSHGSSVPVSPTRSERNVGAASSRKNSVSFSLCSSPAIPVSSRARPPKATKHVDPVPTSTTPEMPSNPSLPPPPKSGKASKKANVTKADAASPPPVIAEPIAVLSPFSNFSSGKKVVLISGRVHPGEITASHGLHGLVTYLLSNNPGAVVLRNHFIFLVVPMLNPDGVSRGHSRMDQFGVNLNRSYNKPDPFLEPTIYQLKKLFEGLLSAYGERFFIYIDFHSHASQSTSFMFGNELPVEVNHWNKAFARLVEIHSSNLFEYPVCRFSKGHMSTKDGASRVLFGLSLIHSYTIELPHFTDRTMFTENFSGMITGRFGVEDILHTFRSSSVTSTAGGSLQLPSGGRSSSTGSSATSTYGVIKEGSFMGSTPSLMVSSRQPKLSPQKSSRMDTYTGEKGTARPLKVQATSAHMEISGTFRGNSMTLVGMEGAGGYRSATPVTPSQRTSSEGSSVSHKGSFIESNSSRGPLMGVGGASKSGRRPPRRPGMGSSGDGGDYASYGLGKQKVALQPIFIPSVLRQSAVVGIACMLALLDYANLGPAMDHRAGELNTKVGGGKTKGKLGATRGTGALPPSQYTGESSLLKQFGGMEKVLKSVRVVEKRTRVAAANKTTPSAGKKKKKKKKVEKDEGN